MVKNPPANAADTGEFGLIPGWGKSPGVGNSNPFQYILAWKISWTKETGGLWSGKKSDMIEQLSTHTHTHTHTHTQFLLHFSGSSEAF